MTVAEAAQRIVDSLREGSPVAEAVIVDSGSPAVPLGARMLVWSDRREGSLGASELDEDVVRLARKALSSRQGAQANLDLGENGVTVYVEPHHPPEDLLIVGAGHIARPLCAVGALLGFRVMVLDDRPGFATRERFPEADLLLQADFSDPLRGLVLGRLTYLVLVTRGHKYDYDTLLDVLRRDVRLAYIGMVGSRRRVRAAFEQLAREGIGLDRLSEVYAPIGLDIGAETPEEIAVAIAGELVRVRRGGTGTSLNEKARVVERWIRGKE